MIPKNHRLEGFRARILKPGLNASRSEQREDERAGVRVHAGGCPLGVGCVVKFFCCIGLGLACASAGISTGK